MRIHPHFVPRSVFRAPRSSERAGILVITIIFCGLVTLVLTAYLSMLKSQHKFTYRSQVWNDCVATCEAGVEEAMSHINYSGTSSNFAINGWTFSAGYYRKQRNLNGGFVRMAIDTAIPPTLLVTGYLRAPTQTNFITRAFQVKTKLNHRFPHAILGKANITCNSSGSRVDSFDSTDPAKSTGGQYDPSKAGDKATVATTSTAKGAIDIGNLDLYGKAGSGPGGTVTLNNGSVGSTAWVNGANDGKIQPGHFADDVNMYVPQPTLPTGFGNNLPILNGLIGLITHTYVLNSGDYRMASVNLTSGQDMYIAGNARLYVSGATTLDGTITIAPGGSLELFMGGNFDCKGAINNPGVAKDLSLVGLSTCTIVNYNGGAKFVGTMNAPRANITINGGAGFYGAAIGNIIKLTGGQHLHYDESLKGNPNEGRYLAAAYQEL
jgi:hypothetical protein